LTEHAYPVIKKVYPISRSVSPAITLNGRTNLILNRWINTFQQSYFKNWQQCWYETLSDEWMF